MSRMTPAQADAAYAALPQAPDAAYAGHPVVPTALMEEDEPDENPDDSTRTLALDTRIRWIMFVLGAAVLLPWNVMITATPYFLSRVDSKLSPTMASYISIVFTAFNFVFLAQATATSRQASNRTRTRWTLIVLSALVFVLFLTTYIKFSPFMFAVIVLSTSALQAVAGSYLQTAVIAAAALFGPIAMQSLMSGQAAVGVALSAVQLISAYGSVHIPSATSDDVILQDDSPARAARAFFGLSTLFLIGTIVIHAWLVRLPAYVAISDQLDAPITLEHSPESHARPESERAQIIRIAKANWVYEVAVALVMTVTLSVFPPITVAVKPLNPNTHPLLFTSAHFLVFNIGDLLGRLLCSFPALLIWSGPRLLIFSILRVVFIPLFLLCNVQTSGAPLTAGAIPDAGFMLLMLAFAVSSGWLSTLGMIAAPNADRNPNLKGRREDVDTAATVASFCLVGGLAGGSIMSFVVRGVMCKCNPLVG